MYAIDDQMCTLSHETRRGIIMEKQDTDSGRGRGQWTRTRTVDTDKNRHVARNITMIGAKLIGVKSWQCAGKVYIDLASEGWVMLHFLTQEVQLDLWTNQSDCLCHWPSCTYACCSRLFLVLDPHSWNFAPFWHSIQSTQNQEKTLTAELHVLLKLQRRKRGDWASEELVHEEQFVLNRGSLQLMREQQRALWWWDWCTEAIDRLATATAHEGTTNKQCAHFVRVRVRCRVLLFHIPVKHSAQNWAVKRVYGKAGHGQRTRTWTWIKMGVLLKYLFPRELWL